MNQRHKGTAKYISALASVLLFYMLTIYCRANDIPQSHFHFSLTQDTLPRGQKALPESINNVKADTSIINKTDTFAIRSSKDSLDAPVVYHADDSVVMDIPGNKIIMYGKETRIKYLDNLLVSPRIEFDQKTSLVTAYLVKDSNGNVLSYPQFNQGDFKTKSDTITFSMKTLKGITKGTYTQQGEIFVYGKKIKKTTPDIFYAMDGRFTTCNLDTPHFAFVSKKIKFVKDKMAYTGPVHPEVEGVPIPVVLPFGIYPLRQGRHSGLLQPSFSANETLGLSLEGMGYYKVINDNWDVVTRGTIYSYGGWTASLSPRYYKRYHYQGNLSLDVLHLRDLDKSGSRSFNIRWTHSTDTKARPGVTFSANVNAGSSGFNSAVPNSPQRNFQNQLNSSISYSKVWKDKPFNLNVNANHNQNTNSKLITINLPDIGFNVNTIYPFRKKEVIGTYKWFENIGVALNSNAKSQSSFYDTAGNFITQFTKKLQYGATHSVPISLSLPQIGNFQLSPSVGYQEKWYQERFVRSWNSIDKKLDTTIDKGLFTAREMQFGMSLSTRIFGLFSFNKNSKVQAIRHEIRPNVSVSYKPDMNKRFFYTAQVDTSGNKQRFTVFERSIFGYFSEGRFGGMSFGIDNNLQMKVKNRKDTGEASIKKVTLLDGFSINSSYNFLEDSFQLRPFSINARTNLFEKVSISASANTMPYVTNANGDFTKKVIWTKNPFSLGKITNANLALQTQFKGGDKNEKIPLNNQQQNVNPVSGLPLNEYQQEAAYINNNPGEFANFNIPWSISLSYAFTYSRQSLGSLLGYSKQVTQNVNWNGTLNLTSKWQIGLNGSYNITNKDLGVLSMYLTRDLHCWQMAINISPVGRYRFFNITINPKSSILRDLKINRTRYFYDL